MQERLPRRTGKRADTLLANPRFRAGYDFLLLREESGEQTQGLGDFAGHRGLPGGRRPVNGDDHPFIRFHAIVLPIVSNHSRMPGRMYSRIPRF